MQKLFLICVLLASTPASAQENRDPFDRGSTPIPLWTIERVSPPIVNVHTAKHVGEESHCVQPKDWKDWGSFVWCRSLEWLDAERIIAIFTVILGLATCILGAATIKLWRATDRLVMGAANTAERQLRAYVSVKTIKMEDYRNAGTMGVDGTVVPGTVHNYKIAAEIENTGQTPTRKAVVNINRGLRPTKLPDDFDFPDGPKSEVAAIGARSTFDTLDFFVSIAEVEKVIEKKQKMYVWGWVDYNDVFERTPRHRTEFCFEIVLDRVPNGQEIKMRFPSHERYNGIDGDCQRVPKPYTEYAK